MIDGSYSVLYIKWNGQFLPVGCLTSDSFSEESETLDTTTRDNNGWKTSVPTRQGYNLSFEGVVKNTNFSGGDATKISLDRLTALKRGRVLVEWEVVLNGSEYTEWGEGYITSLSKSASVDEFISFTCDIEGFGVYGFGGS